MSAAFDVAVIGLGAVGSAAARLCAARGMRVVGFDRFEPPHTFGSSHGGSRIIRRAYFEGAMYVPILNRAYELWRELENESGVQLIRRVGALTAGRAQGDVVAGAAKTAARFGIPHEILEPHAVAERFPAFVLRENEAAVWEPDAGWIHPEDAIRVQLARAAALGTKLRFGEPVAAWSASGGGVRVHTAAAVHEARSVIVCAGGWTGPLLAALDLPLHIERQVNVWYRPRRRPETFRPPQCPVFIWADDDGTGLYGFPDTGPGVKAGLHHRGEEADRPEDVDREVTDDDVRRLSSRLEIMLPDACGNVASAATCFYTNTPDERYLIDRHPGHPSVFFASACSGHGFKASIAVGEILAALACEEAPSVDFSAFRLSPGARNHEATTA